MDGADRRAAHAEAQPPQPLANFRRAPVWKVSLQRDDLVLERPRQLVGVAVRPTAAIRQASQAPMLVPLVDLVARLPGDAEFGTEAGHGVALHQAGHKPQTFVLHVTLLPRHAPSC